MPAPPNVRKAAPAGGLRETDELGGKSRLEHSGTRAAAQHLALAGEHVAGAERLLVAAALHLDGLGLDIGATIAEVAALADDIDKLATGRARLADVPAAGLEPWQVEATRQWREERARRGRRA